jgi:hypothetical protein
MVLHQSFEHDKHWPWQVMEIVVIALIGIDRAEPSIDLLRSMTYSTHARTVAFNCG